MMYLLNFSNALDDLVCTLVPRGTSSKPELRPLLLSHRHTFPQMGGANAEHAI